MSLQIKTNCSYFVAAHPIRGYSDDFYEDHKSRPVMNNSLSHRVVHVRTAFSPVRNRKNTFNPSTFSTSEHNLTQSTTSYSSFLVVHITRNSSLRTKVSSLRNSVAYDDTVRMASNWMYWEMSGLLRVTPLLRTQVFSHSDIIPRFARQHNDKVEVNKRIKSKRNEEKDSGGIEKWAWYE